MVEVGIDSLLDNGVLKNVPIVSLLVGIAKTAQNVHDRNLLKQTLVFINEFNGRAIPEEKVEKYRKRLAENPKYAEEELGRVIILLNSNVDRTKSALLAKFYHAYINADIEWSLFCELADITSRMFVSDLHILRKVYQKEITDTTQCEGYRTERLIALGVLDSAMRSMSIGSISGSKTSKYVQVNSLGSVYCKIGLG